MEIVPSQRVQSIGSYAFAEVDEKVKQLEKEGIEPIDFGVGDPTIPPPPIVRDAVKEGVETHKTAGYPSYIGMDCYRETIARWTEDRFGVSLDPEKEITSSIGAKEGVFNFAEGFVDPGDTVIVPTPGYPPYTRGTIFAEGEVFYVPVLPENNYLIDLDDIPGQVADAARIIWVNYPNSPTGAVAPREYLEKIVEFGQNHNIIVASDEAYSEIYYTEEPPISMLEVGREGVVVFQSLSKRSAMTGYRVGWVAGDRRIVEIFKKVKTNIDSGTANFVQEAAIAALNDEEHVCESRELYRQKRDLLADALVDSGLPDCRPEATIYLWQSVPEGHTSVDFATSLLDPDIAVVTTPGAWISNETRDGLNPGEGFVRFALVPSLKNVEKAAERIRDASW
ncbi:MAG: aminotransferase class I/II-fold pyridoxal phosphate-dependent enzyme [Candidatus Brocadiia bacterium]